MLEGMEKDGAERNCLSPNVAPRPEVTGPGYTERRGCVPRLGRLTVLVLGSQVGRAFWNDSGFQLRD